MPTKQEFSYRNEMDHLRKDMAGLSAELEDAETLIMKLKRELNEALLTIGTMQGENSRLTKTKKRLQFDFEEAVANLAAERAVIGELHVKIKKITKQMEGDRGAVGDAEADRDEALASLRGLQGKFESLEDKLRATERKIGDIEEEKRQLSLSLVSITEKKNRSDRTMEDMEGIIGGLERKLADLKAQLADVQGDNKSKEAELRGMDLALSTAKGMAANESGKAEEKIDALSAQLAKVTRVLQTTEGELESAISKAAGDRRVADQALNNALKDNENLAAQNAELLATVQRLKSRLPSVRNGPEFVFDD